jgi:hypothetical protein
LSSLEDEPQAAARPAAATAVPTIAQVFITPAMY